LPAPRPSRAVVRSSDVLVIEDLVHSVDARG